MFSQEQVCLEIERSGRNYQFSFQNLDTGFEYLVWHESACIGKIICGYEEDNSIKLYDINLYSSEGTKHRKQGIGTQLIGLAINQARSKGFSRIFGSVIQTDIQLKPDLLEWYASNGFHLLENLNSMGNLQVEYLL